MFDLKRPCNNCPFRKGAGQNFKLDAKRLDVIIAASSFQCHNTVDYENFDDPIKRQGNKPQQCAGLMSLLHRAGQPNQIMQVAERLIGFDAGQLEHSCVYDSIEEAKAAHG